MVWISYHPNDKIQSSESNRFILVIQTLQHYVSEMRKQSCYLLEFLLHVFAKFWFASLENQIDTKEH